MRMITLTMTVEQFEARHTWLELTPIQRDAYRDAKRLGRKVKVQVMDGPFGDLFVFGLEMADAEPVNQAIPAARRSA